MTRQEASVQVPQEAVDHAARHDAAMAHQRIDDHEKLCAERWDTTQRAIERLRKVIEKRFGWLIILVVGTLISAVGTLLAMLLGPT